MFQFCSKYNNCPTILLNDRIHKKDDMPFNQINYSNL